jgi:hypothetical protein
MVLRRIFGFLREEAAGGKKELHQEELTLHLLLE